MQIRVVSYNIRHGEGTDRKADLERIAKVIIDLSPDLVSLQEVDRCMRRTARVDQAQRLSDLTGMNSVFGRAMDMDDGQYGVAVLSRFPIARYRNHPLPWKKREPRTALETVVDVRGTAVRFVATHLDWLEEDASERLLQVEQLNRLFAAQDDAPPTILAGDLNDQPGSSVLDVLERRWTLATAGLPPSWPDTEPRLRIDHILFRPGTALATTEIRVVDAPVASDHLPVLAVLTAP